MIINVLIGELKTIIFGVFSHSSLLWQIIPLLVLWFVLEIYFGRYRNERLGWNTALANGLSMFWIVLSSLQFVFSNQKDLDLNWSLFLSLFLILGYALSIVSVSFNHSLKSNWAFLIASLSPVYYFSIISLLIAHQIIVINLFSIIAIFILFIAILLFFFLFRFLIPKASILDKESLNSNDSFDLNNLNSNSLPSPSSKKQFNSVNEKSPLETELDSTFSSKTDPFSNEFASTVAEKDVLIKKEIVPKSSASLKSRISTFFGKN